MLPATEPAVDATEPTVPARPTTVLTACAAITPSTAVPAASPAAAAPTPATVATVLAAVPRPLTRLLADGAAGKVGRVADCAVMRPLPASAGLAAPPAPPAGAVAGLGAACCSTSATLCSPAARRPWLVACFKASRARSSGVRGIRLSSSVLSASSSRLSLSPDSHGETRPWLLSNSVLRVERKASAPVTRGVAIAPTKVRANREAASSAGLAPPAAGAAGRSDAAGRGWATPSALENSATMPGGNFCSASPSCGRPASAGCW